MITFLFKYPLLLYQPILIKFWWMKYDLRTQRTTCMKRLRGFLTFRIPDLITILTYVHMDNFCPFFKLNFILTIRKNILICEFIFLSHTFTAAWNIAGVKVYRYKIVLVKLYQPFQSLFIFWTFFGS